MQALSFLLVDELLQGENEGFPTVDYSLASDAVRRHFYLHCVLLFLVGDYPGMGKMANMVHSGYSACHWCEHRFGYHSAGHNVALGNRCHLPSSSPLRVDPRFGSHCLFAEAPPPLRRTHAKTVAAAREIELLQGSSRDAIVKATGVRGLCLFVFLFLFDIIADCLPDMMHILKDLWQHYFVPYFKGEVTPKVPQPQSTTYVRQKKTYNHSPEELQLRQQKYDKAKEVHNETLKVLALHCSCVRIATILLYRVRSCIKHTANIAINRARYSDCAFSNWV